LFGFNQYKGDSPFSLSLLDPASCSKAFDSGVADIALVPVAFLEGRDDYNIITDYCIGADGPVNSVALLSNSPISLVESLILDDHSMTSNRLVKILLEHHWNKQVDFVKKDVSQGIQLKDNEAVVMIGDKVFEQQEHYQYKYDLAEMWKEMTGLPFVFAVWIAKKNILPEYELQLNNMLKKGVDNIDSIIESEMDPIVDLREYLTINLKYKLTNKYQLGLNTFLKDYHLPESVH